jgi:hypothetical protein
MKEYKSEITLNRNKRGCYILDTVKGCSGGRRHNNKGCYGDCYAKRIADRYRFNFSKPMIRNINNIENQLFLFGLKDRTHTDKIRKEINKAKMPFIRIGEMGDPSENWEHTLSVCEEILPINKKLVIVTKHWNIISDKMLKMVGKLGICINTSISALDDEEEIQHRLSQFYRLKDVCNSVLRIVSCDFNKDNPEGLGRFILQEELFKHKNNIDTIFRPSPTNQFLISNVIKAKKTRFIDSFVLASVYNKKTYFGKCGSCNEMCGITN